MHFAARFLHYYWTARISNCAEIAMEA